MAKKCQYKVPLFIRRWEQNHVFFPDEEITLRINTMHGKTIETMGSINGHHIYCLDDQNVIMNNIKDMRFIVQANSSKKIVILIQVP